jgi:hypothetical protein
MDVCPVAGNRLEVVLRVKVLQGVPHLGDGL